METLEIKKCLNCGSKLPAKNKSYCDCRCQSEHKRRQWQQYLKNKRNGGE